MNLIVRLKDRFIKYLESEDFPEQQFKWLYKSLCVFLILKIFFLWNVLSAIVEFTPSEPSSVAGKILFAPGYLALYDSSYFMIVAIAVLLAVLFLRPYFILSFSVLWISICLSKLAQPVANGSDLVLNLFLFLASVYYAVPFLKLRSARMLLLNFIFLLCQIQLALIYFLSGFDKLMSNAWRTGDAIYSIAGLEYFISPAVIPMGRKLQSGIAWSVIVFELAFSLLIWLKPLRIFLLIAGVILHLGIIYFLSLPDFGVLMILAYILFLPGKWFTATVQAEGGRSLR